MLRQRRSALGRLEGDLNLSSERLANAGQRRVRALEERGLMEQRAASINEMQKADQEISRRETDVAKACTG